MESDQNDLMQELLDSDSATVDDVVGSDFFLQCLKAEYKPLLEYLSKDDVIRGMSRWIFTRSAMCHPRFAKMSSSVLKVFASSIPQVFLVYLESPTFADVCYSFLSSNESVNPKLCGFLFTILSQQIRWGNPKFFKQYGDVGDLLFARMSNLSIQELIILAASRQNIKIFDGSQLILNLSTMGTCKSSELSRSAISILLQLYDTLGDESPLLEEFFDKDIVANLFKICIETESILVSNDIAAVLTSLYTFECDLEPNLSKYRKQLVLASDNITPVSCAFIPVFNPSFIDIFHLFFKPNAHKFLHNYCSQLVMRLSTADINTLAQDSDFIKEWMAAFGTSHWCSHMVQISLILARMTNECKALQFPEWESFIKCNILPLLKVVEKEYGGPSNMQNPHNMASMEEEEYVYESFEEEEEEEEEEEADIGQHAEMDNSDDDDNDDDENGKQNKQIV